ncbi:MAG: DUF268 domain-containing protein [Sulfurovum sp.]|nr:DUF268 domain-containing protein [Sulfurovum sp.]
MKNKLKTILRLLNPVINMFNLIKGFKNLFRYPSFMIGYFKYKSMSNEIVEYKDLWPELNDKTSASQTGGGQYFYQDNWALKKVYQSQVKEHFDVGSRIDGFTSQCSIFTKVNFIDFRYVEYHIENMKCIEGDILNLPFEDNSINSLSCLHVIEHIGLGRYGDPINPNGSIEALKELQRVLAKDGDLYLGIPIGKERVMYHAHRIFNPNTIVKELDDLVLIEFCAVDDKGIFVEKVNLDDFYEAFYSLGLFHFRRKQNDKENN